MWRIDPTTNAVVATIPVPPTPVQGRDIAVGGGSVWAESAISSSPASTRPQVWRLPLDWHRAVARPEGFEPPTY